jgi:hypothetical protein
MSMLCFVDESGDTGLKVGQGSSRYFTVALVLFSDEDEAVACDQRIGLLRRELGLPSEFEFHFVETPRRIKEAFFNAVVPYNFFYQAITINKAALYGEGFKYKDSFYKFTCGLVFENAKSYLDRATVVFDGSGSRQFKQALERYLKRKMNEEELPRIHKVKIQDSSKNNLVQLADMVCGAVALSMKSVCRDRNKFRRMIAHRELLCQIWPRVLDQQKKQEYQKVKETRKRSVGRKKEKS